MCRLMIENTDKDQLEIEMKGSTTEIMTCITMALLELGTRMKNGQFPEYGRDQDKTRAIKDFGSYLLGLNEFMLLIYDIVSSKSSDPMPERAKRMRNVHYGDHSDKGGNPSEG